MYEFKCKQCNKSFEKYKSLSLHMNRTHGIEPDQFYVEYYLNGIWPTCKCGCEELVVWSYIKKMFCDYRQGHQSRVHNNWGHNQKAIEKSAETRREQFASGGRMVWNKGLTKEIDIRVKKYGDGISKNFTEDRKKKYSTVMCNNRLNGTVTTLYGSESSRWKGGVSEINNIARNDKRLYDEWKYPILIRDGFKCVKCGNFDSLHIHHDKESMSDIVKKHIVDEEPKDFEFKKIIAEKIVNYHINNNVSGVTLCKECHNELHPNLNFD